MSALAASSASQASESASRRGRSHRWSGLRYVSSRPTGSLSGRMGGEFVAFGFTVDGVALGYAGGAWFGQGLLKFVQGVLARDVIIVLGVAFAVEGEATQFAADVAAIGLVAIVLRPPGTELHNVIPRLYLVGKVAEVIAEHQGRLAWALHEDHGIGVVMQRAIPEEVEGVVEVQSDPAGGETGHEDVKVRGDGDVFLVGFVMYLHAVFGE